MNVKLSNQKSAVCSQEPITNNQLPLTIRRTACPEPVEGQVIVSADTHKKPFFWLKSQSFEHLNLGNLDLFRI